MTTSRTASGHENQSRSRRTILRIRRSRTSSDAHDISRSTGSGHHRAKHHSAARPMSDRTASRRGSGNRIHRGHKLADRQCARGAAARDIYIYIKLLREIYFSED